MEGRHQLGFDGFKYGVRQSPKPFAAVMEYGCGALASAKLLVVKLRLRAPGRRISIVEYPEGCGPFDEGRKVYDTGYKVDQPGGIAPMNELGDAL